MLLVLGTRLLGGRAHGFELLNLKEGEEQKEVLEAKDDEEEESEVDGEVEEKVTQSMHATCRWLWDRMTNIREHLEPQCVHKEWVREQQKQRLTTKTPRRLNHVYAHAHVFPKCFKSLHTLSGFVLCLCVVSSRQFLSLYSCTQFWSESKFLVYFTLRKRVFWGGVFRHSVGCSGPPSAVNDLSATKKRTFKKIAKAVRLRFYPKICRQRVAPFDRKPLHASSWLSLNSQEDSIATKWTKNSMLVSIFWYFQQGVGLSCCPPASRCKRFNVDNAWLKSERFLNGPSLFPDLLREIHQFCLLWQYSDSDIR